MNCENKLVTSTESNVQVLSLNGRGVGLIHLHFLPSAIHRCSQHRLPGVCVFLLYKYDPVGDIGSSLGPCVYGCFGT